MAGSWRKMKKQSSIGFILGFVLIFSAQSLLSQQTETLMTDRPGQAMGPLSAGKQVFQLQAGFDWRGVNEKTDDYTEYTFAPNTLLRFGITEALEINSFWEYRSGRASQEDSSWTSGGLGAATIGTRFNIFRGQDYMPSVGIQMTLKLPILSMPYAMDYLAPQIMLLASEKITDNISVLINLGADWNGIDAAASGIYVANVSFGISSNWGAFIENYGSFTGNSFETRFDGGFAYLLTNNLQFDLYGGLGKNNGKIDYFTSIGVSWRLLPLSNDK